LQIEGIMHTLFLKYDVITRLTFLFENTPYSFETQGTHALLEPDDLPCKLRKSI
jgi:hypothetical protein